MPLFGTIASAKRLYYTHELLHLTPTYWWTLNDSSISNVVIMGDTITSIASGGSEPTIVTTAGTGVTSALDNGNRYFYGSDSSGRLAASSMPTPYGNGTSVAVIARVDTSNFNSQYFFDGELDGSPRVSMSFDSFGQDIGAGEWSIHSGYTYGYDSGDATMGGRLNTSQHTVGLWYAYFGSTSSFGSWSSVSTDTVNSQLFNNSSSASSSTAAEIILGNRHSNNRAHVDVQIAEVIMFCGKELSSGERTKVWEYFNFNYT